MRWSLLRARAAGATVAGRSAGRSARRRRSRSTPWSRMRTPSGYTDTSVTPSAISWPASTRTAPRSGRRNKRVARPLLLREHTEQPGVSLQRGRGRLAGAGIARGGRGDSPEHRSRHDCGSPALRQRWNGHDGGRGSRSSASPSGRRPTQARPGPPPVASHAAARHGKGTSRVTTIGSAIGPFIDGGRNSACAADRP